VGDLKEKKTVI